MRTIAVMFLLAGVALADKPPSAQQKADAKAHFAEGEKAFRLGDFAKAIDEYKQSYELFPAPLLLYDLGQAHRKAGDYEKALHFYQQYLDTAPTAERRATVQGLVAELKGLIEQQHKTQSAPPAGTGSPDREATHPPQSVSEPPAGSPSPAPATPTSTEHGETGPSRRGLWVGIGAAALVVLVAAVVVGVAFCVTTHPAPPSTTNGGFTFGALF